MGSVLDAGANLSIGLKISEGELRRAGCTLSNFSFNSYTKLSPIRWIDDSDWMTIFVDLQMTRRKISRCHSRLKVGILQESGQIFPAARDAAVKVRQQLDLILTHDDDLINQGPPFSPYIPGGILLKPSERVGIVPKRLQASISVSEKCQTDGHKLRHRIVNELADEFSLRVLGRGYQHYRQAGTPYEDFAYTIAVENERFSHNITEKLLQPMLFRTVPIYWGGSEADSIFDPEGLLTFDTIEDLRQLLGKISMEDYLNRQKAIEANYITAQRFISKEINILRAIHRSGKIPNFDVQIPEPKISESGVVEPGRKFIDPTHTRLSSDRMVRALKSMFAGRPD